MHGVQKNVFLQQLLALGCRLHDHTTGIEKLPIARAPYRNHTIVYPRTLLHLLRPMVSQIPRWKQPRAIQLCARSCRSKHGNKRPNHKALIPISGNGILCVSLKSTKNASRHDPFGKVIVGVKLGFRSTYADTPTLIRHRRTRRRRAFSSLPPTSCRRSRSLVASGSTVQFLSALVELWAYLKLK